MGKSGKKDFNKKDPEREFVTTDLENPGNYLRTLRIGKGLSPKEVSEATRISESNIRAIEDQDFATLPAPTFTRGLLNIYAKFLGADTEKIIERFMREQHASSAKRKGAKPKQHNKILKPKRLAEPSHVSSMVMAGILLILIIASFTGYCVYTSWNPFSFLFKANGEIPASIKSVFPPAQTTLPSVPQPSGAANTSEREASPQPAAPAMPPTQVNQDQKRDGTSAAEAAAPAKKTALDTEEKAINASPAEPPAGDTGYTISIHFLQNTGIQVTRDKDQPVSQDFSAGDTHSWHADSSLIMTFSQPDSAEIMVNGSAVKFPGPMDGSYTLKIPTDAAEKQADE